MSAATNLYFDRKFEKQAAKLLPGEFYSTDEDMLLVTVLGSCVSLCLRDRDNGIGGMNHFMLPEGESESARYGAYAMEVLINESFKRGAKRERLEAKLFGGGAVLADLTTLNIGEKNARFAHDFLATEGVRVVAEDLLGPWPRKVYYFPRTGRALIKRLNEVKNDTIVKRERAYRGELAAKPVAGTVDLF